MVTDGYQNTLTAINQISLFSSYEVNENLVRLVHQNLCGQITILGPSEHSHIFFTAKSKNKCSYML
jgi:hypothetical protein